MDATSSALPRVAGQPGARSVRRYELDWLRTGAVFGLIPFHTAVIFTTGSYDYVKNAQTSAAMDLFTSFITIWGIPLLFLVAGGSARYALAARSVKRYLNERVTRLLVPFIFAMLLIVPTQIYIGRLSSPSPPPFLTFYGQFLLSLALIFTGKLPRGPDWIGHLWFIPPLMIFAALAIPFAWLLRTPRGRAAVEWLAGCMRGYSVLALFGLPLALVQWLGLQGVAFMVTMNTQFASNVFGVVAFLLFFLYGYLLYLDERFLSSLRRDTWVALALGVVLWITLAFVIPRWGMAYAGEWWAYVALALIRGYCGWWWVMGILGLGIRYLQFTNPLERYLARAAYPVYIIHMPVLSLIALWVVKLDITIILKFLLIIVAALVAALLIYDRLILRIGVLRMLFGLSAPLPASGPPSPRPGAAPGV